MRSLPHVNVNSHFCFFSYLQQMIFVLSGFIHVLFSMHHWFRVSNNLSRVSGLSTISSRSSACMRVFIWHVPKLIPLASWFKKSIRSLMKTLNKVGERGQPCFTPWLIIMGEERSLFIICSNGENISAGIWSHGKAIKLTSFVGNPMSQVLHGPLDTSLYITLGCCAPFSDTWISQCPCGFVITSTYLNHNAPEFHVTGLL